MSLTVCNRLVPGVHRIAWHVLAAASCLAAGCPRNGGDAPVRAATRPAGSQSTSLQGPVDEADATQAADSVDASQSQPAPLEGLHAEEALMEEGCLVIEEKADEQLRAWIEGSVEGSDKIVIGTHNISRFRLDLSRLHIDWDRGVVLSIDGFNSELTRKHWPVLRLTRTPSGAWIAMDD